MFERFSRSARAVVVSAHEEARLLRHTHIGPEHLLLALAKEQSGPVADTWARHGLNRSGIEDAVRRTARTTPEAIDADALRSVGIDLAEIKEAVDAEFGAGSFEDAAEGSRTRWLLRRSWTGGGRVRFDDHAKKSLELALREALLRGDREIGSAHLLLGVLRDDAPVTRRVLADLGVGAPVLRTTLEDELRRSA